MYVMIDGGRVEISTKRYIEPHKWSSDAQKAFVRPHA
ncbi:hypothetical protein [Mucilaginibacter aquaedulcis]|nr:hypothetical protein [Mucilaginibacter aquaedulcis]MDN3548345.1 hypothetical protein [Mucilaginibacter aquaedulcis]